MLNQNFPRERDPRQRVWTAMRILKRFSKGELIATADVARKTVDRYVQALTRFGYVRLATTPTTGRAATYQLVSDLGPLAPDVGPRGRGPLVDPDWLLALRLAVAQSSQVRVARQLGLSQAAISKVLAGRYPARTHRIAARVRELLPPPPPIACPVLGELKPETCLFHQARPFAATNPQRIALWRACRNGCPHANPRIQP